MLIMVTWFHLVISPLSVRSINIDFLFRSFSDTPNVFNYILKPYQIMKYGIVCVIQHGVVGSIRLLSDQRRQSGKPSSAHQAVMEEQ